jgi:tungstate transport system ATP-binding protein
MVYTISRITKVYGNRTVLDIPYLEIAKGSIYALLGPNGAGKTTLLNMLGFLEAPTTGIVHYHSTPVHFSEPYLQNLRKEVVVVDQHPILFTTTVYKNLEFGLKIRRIPPQSRAQIIEESLDLVGMRPFSRESAHQLSGGETQRVAIARALAVNPQVLLCDEPTSSVDAENQVAIINILRQINELKNITIVFTTHDRSQVSSLAHHTLFLDHGKLAASAQENLFTAVLNKKENNHVRCVIQDTVEIKIPTEKDGKVRIFIDPESVYLSDVEEKGCNNNAQKGRVLQVMEENAHIRVVVDIGIWITLYMSKQKYSEIQPMVGEQVRLTIPPDAVEIL